MPEDRPAVLMDVDGTLVDTNWFHTVSWWRAFRDAGEDVSMSKIHPLIGMGAPGLVERVLGRPDEKVVDGHADQYKPFLDEVRPFPRARDLLEELRRRGVLVVLATSSDERDVPRLQEIIGGSVDGVVCKSDVERGKPAPDIFGAALDRFDLEPGRTLVVGDTVWDVEAAAELGLGVVAVLTGGVTRDQLTDAGAVAVYEDVADLLDNLDESPLGELLRSSPSAGSTRAGRGS
ncbi:MAG TPA: HAD family hydrolase [Acidimicrobiales bacterium]|nr:HAD family hydrolase [Acidimicrobiales bacterium]